MAANCAERKDNIVIYRNIKLLHQRFHDAADQTIKVIKPSTDQTYELNSHLINTCPFFDLRSTSFLEFYGDQQTRDVAITDNV